MLCLTSHEDGHEEEDEGCHGVTFEEEILGHRRHRGEVLQVRKYLQKHIVDSDIFLGYDKIV